MSIQRILVVDDQDSMRMLLCSALRALGHPDIVTAANGAEGLTMLRGRLIDLVLLDVEMPVMGGFEMLTELRADPKLQATPVIMVTARADAGFVQAIQPLNVLGYLVKPVTAAALRSCMARAA
jgi:two-component system chemotaxis response regulator CheY